MGLVPLIGTGLSGLVGSTITQLLANKYQLTNLDLTSGVDILDQAQIDSIIKASPAKSVVHLAAFTDVNKANQQRGDRTGLCYRLNVEGTRNIAQACAQFGKHLTHISTDYVYDGTKSTAYTETDRPHPIEWYGQTKLWAEEVVTQSACRSIIMRISYPYGSNHPQRRDIIQKISHRLQHRCLPPQFSDNLITPTYIRDIASAIDYFINHQTTGLYHVVGATALSSHDLAVKIAKQLRLNPAGIQPSSVVEYNQTAPRPFQARLNLSNHKYITDTGLTPIDIDTGLAMLFNRRSAA